MHNHGRYIFQICLNFFQTKLYPFLLPDHYVGHEDGDTEIAETHDVSPYSSEKANNKTSRTKHLRQMVTYTRLNRSRHLAISKKKRKLDTSTVLTSGAKRQKQKDNVENNVDTSTLQQ